MTKNRSERGREFVLHFAIYQGFPKATVMEAALGEVRPKWQRQPIRRCAGRIAGLKRPIDRIGNRLEIVTSTANRVARACSKRHRSNAQNENDFPDHGMILQMGTLAR